MKRSPSQIRHWVVGIIIAGLLLLSSATLAADDAPLPGTAKLEMQGDITSQLVEGVDRFLLREIDKSVEQRAGYWHRDFTSPEKYAASVGPNRKRLAHILGVRDARAIVAPEDLQGGVKLAETKAYAIYVVRWPAFGDVWAEGLLLEPRQPLADVVLLPDADQTPEMLVGLADPEKSLPPETQIARRLAESHCRVLAPSLVSREVHKRRAARITDREFIYRSAFELGRHVIGYEVQETLAGVDWLLARRGKDTKAKIAVMGYGEGGLLALCAAALDPRIEAACVSGYFDSRQNVWQEPVDRNVFSLLQQFGDAEIASLIAPRTLIIEAALGPQFVIPPGTGGAPGRIVTPALDDAKREVERARRLIAGLRPAARIDLVASGDGTGPAGSPAALEKFLSAVDPAARLAPLGEEPKWLGDRSDEPGRIERRQARLVHQLDRHNQRLLLESPEVRKEYFKRLDTSSLEKFQRTIEPYRQQFYNEIIGRFDYPLLPPNARSRKTYDEPKHTGYEVVLDVFPDVIAYGILLLPKDLAAGQQRPVVVCQHGLEGRPQDTLRGGRKAYAGFASSLADEGFITFSPQNLYIFGDRFRSLQRKANPLGKTLFSMIVPQHQQIVDWLGSLPMVDKRRIAFYGLSYGGKTAMRVPPLVANYCLSICSGDFNEWVWKNASSRGQYTYVGTGEYEIYEFDLGSTFNYAEMAALVAPRPFMVERGHFDGVAPDEMVAYEFAKVRFLYEAKLGIGDRCRLEWFVGPHEIHGVGTFEFLREKLDWPKR